MTISGDGLILVVDDQPMMLKVVGAMLADGEFEIVTVDDPGRAATLAADRARDLRLLITDLHMARMDGEELAREVRRQCPGIRVLFMSGDLSRNRELAADPGFRFIAKPFSAGELRSNVATLLAE